MDVWRWGGIGGGGGLLYPKQRILPQSDGSFPKGSIRWEALWGLALEKGGLLGGFVLSLSRAVLSTPPQGMWTAEIMV